MFENIYRYQRFEDFKITLQEIARAFPELVRLETIGTSFRGREIFLVKVTDFSKGREEDKNAFYADACTHAEEFSGCNALLSLIKQLAEGFEKDEIIRDLLSHTVFYLIPRLNPDGIEFAMEGHPWCGNGRYLPSESQPLDGFYWEDLDDNGIIANMRIEDPDGEWKISEKEPRLMTLRSPGEHGGKYYRLYPEGRIRGKVEGAPLPKPRDGNLNRNYPSLWTPEGMQYGAGDLPLSEPETRAVADFMVTHKNIAMVLSLHTNAGVILRPFGHQSDSHYKGRELLYSFVMNSDAHNKRMNRDTTSESIIHSRQASLWEVRYVRIEDNREDPADPCYRRADADPVDRDLSEQYIRGDSGNPGIHLRSDWNSQSGLRTGLRA